MAVAIYLRVSSTKGQETRSQEPDLLTWAKAQAEEVVWYRDRFTGTTMERPGLERLLADVRSGKVAKVCVWRLDRLGRTAKGLLTLLDELQVLGVGFVSLREGFDLATPAGRLMAGVLASAAAMDKEFTKKLLAAEGLPVCRWVALRPGADTLTDEQAERLGLPVFVKPARAGSSIGVSRVDRWADLPDAVALARRTDPKVLVEAAVPGREIECGVLEFPDGRVEASPTAEIRAR